MGSLIHTYLVTNIGRRRRKADQGAVKTLKETVRLASVNMLLVKVPQNESSGADVGGYGALKRFHHRETTNRSAQRAGI